MDIFSRLPSLVLANILGQIQSDKDLLNTLRASPELLRTHGLSRHTIMRQRLAGFLSLDIDGTILQDAQAVIHFPPIDGVSPIALPAMSECLDTWNARGFPNPLMQQAS